MKRRTFIKTGIAGSALLALTGAATRGTFWGAGSKPARSDDYQYRFLTHRDHQVLFALVPVIMAGIIETEPDTERAVEETIQAYDRAVSAFLPEGQKEVRQLFSLLTLAPTRWLVVGIRSSWQKADAATLHAFLARWDTSKSMMLRSAHDALVQITIGSYYGRQGAWAGIGYPGPPEIG